MSEIVGVDENDTNAEASHVSPNPKRRKLRSLVWKDFTKERKADGSFVAMCNHCKKPLTGNSRSGTTHLKNHLRICLSNQRIQRKKLGIRRPLLKSSEIKNDEIANLECFQFDQELSRQDLARMIVLHEYPFSIVQHIGFRTFLKNLQPQFNLMSRNTVRADCMKIYEDASLKLYEILDKLPCRVSLTADMWRSSRNAVFMCLTCHYVDDDWKLQKKILNFLHVEAPHMGEEISKAIIGKFYDWNIDKKLFSIVLDNRNTNDVVVRELLKFLRSKGSLLLNGDVFHVRCCAQILNLIAQDALESIREVINKVRDSVKYVNSSEAILERFLKIEKQVLASQKLLVLDVPTRWESTYSMLETACEFQDSFSRLAECDSKFTHLPSSKDWNNIKAVTECLKVFYDMIKGFSSMAFPTSNLYFNCLCCVYLSLKTWCLSPLSSVVSMASQMLEKFEKYWDIISLVLAIASILDPRYKMKSVEYFFNLIYEDKGEAKLKIENVLKGLTNLYNEYVVHSDYTSRSQALICHVGSSSGSTECGSGGGSETSSRHKLAQIRWGLDQFLQETSSRQQLKSDLDMYLEEAVHPSGKGLDDNFDILAWWKFSAPKYPILSTVARDILGIPVSTVASEAAFSIEDRVLDQYRSSLNANTIQSLICAQDWLRDEIKASPTVGLAYGLSTMSTAPSLDGDDDESCPLLQ